MNSNYQLYSQWIKPSWSPPAWLFGPVWTLLYALIIVTFGYVIFMFVKGRISFWVLLPFVLNLVFNLIFTYIQFGLNNLPLAALDVLLVWGTLVWLIIAIFPFARWVAYLNIPYLAWVSFASVLQLTVTWLNRLK